MGSKFILVLSIASQVVAHGFVQSFVADGVSYQGYNPSFQFANPIPTVAGWSDPQNLPNGFISDYTSPDIACHLAATPGKTYANVSAGGSVQVQWTAWPDSHKGPVIDYLAACNGDCTTVDKTKLLWNKIDQSGLLDGTVVPGKYASDVLIQAGSKWTINIPSNIAPGNYVLRHEIIALHAAGSQGGAQNYPQCINLQVSGSGTTSLASTGVPYNKLYTATDPGILVNIYQKLASYTIPGPALFNNGTSSGGDGNTNNQASPSSSSSTTLSTSIVGTSSSSLYVVPTSTPSTLQTSTRATTTIVVADTRTGGKTGTANPSPTAKARKFVCYEEL